MVEKLKVWCRWTSDGSCMYGVCVKVHRNRCVLTCSCPAPSANQSVRPTSKHAFYCTLTYLQTYVSTYKLLLASQRSRIAAAAAQCGKQRKSLSLVHDAVAHIFVANWKHRQHSAGQDSVPIPETFASSPHRQSMVLMAGTVADGDAGPRPVRPPVLPQSEVEKSGAEEDGTIMLLQITPASIDPGRWSGALKHTFDRTFRSGGRVVALPLRYHHLPRPACNMKRVLALTNP